MKKTAKLFSKIVFILQQQKMENKKGVQATSEFLHKTTITTTKTPGLMRVKYVCSLHVLQSTGRQFLTPRKRANYTGILQQQQKNKYQLSQSGETKKKKMG